MDLNSSREFHPYDEAGTSAAVLYVDEMKEQIALAIAGTSSVLVSRGDGSHELIHGKENNSFGELLMKKSNFISCEPF